MSGDFIRWSNPDVYPRDFLLRVSPARTIEEAKCDRERRAAKFAPKEG